MKCYQMISAHNTCTADIKSLIILKININLCGSNILVILYLKIHKERRSLVLIFKWAPIFNRLYNLGTIRVMTMLKIAQVSCMFTATKAALMPRVSYYLSERITDIWMRYTSTFLVCRARST